MCYFLVNSKQCAAKQTNKEKCVTFKVVEQINTFRRTKKNIHRRVEQEKGFYFGKFPLGSDSVSQRSLACFLLLFLSPINSLKTFDKNVPDSVLPVQWLLSCHVREVEINSQMMSSNSKQSKVISMSGNICWKKDFNVTKRLYSETLAMFRRPSLLV